ncbi:MAG: dihydrodipicolinate synthase family protein [Propionicimonas sp.]|nr:dihydrodipicolinate synthase family protein [Propionicimonas sp.]MEA5119018.1 dihydrodipicolinate synthase family protein [Propionicimonas sp.]
MFRPAVYSAVPTAFTSSGELDRRSTMRLFEHVVAGGVDTLFVNGTTGEFPALSRRERLECLRLAIDVAGRDQVVAHVGAASPHHTAELASDARSIGITRMSVVTPYFLPASATGVRKQVAAVAGAGVTDGLYLYVFPDRTGVALSPSEAAAILEEFDLAGIKISIPGTDYVHAISEALSTPRDILSGNDDLLPEVIAAGATGIVSGVSASVPAPFAGLADALASGDQSRSSALNGLIKRLVAVLGLSIAGLKYSLALQGVIDSPTCRMAIDDPTEQDRVAIARALTAEVGFVLR